MKINLIKGIAVILFIFIGIPSRNQTLNILTLGNSITQSNSFFKSYRYSLWTKLIDDGFDFNYVGSMTIHYNCGTPVFPAYQGQTFDQDHEGHWGWRCDQILDGSGSSANCRGSGSLAGWLTNYTPDIVLAHLGTNDIYQGQSIASTILDIKQVINTLRTDNPNVIILLAQLTPTVSPVFNPLITQMNAEIPSIAVDLADPDSPIYIVDQNTGFNPVTDTWDGVHPNEIGEEKMAEKWRIAIAESQTGVKLNAYVYLEGAFNGSDMKTDLTPILPLSQPYTSMPWDYQGDETVGEIPPNIVDWVLVELRDTTEANLASSSARIVRQAAFIRNNGEIVGLDGSSELSFSNNIVNQLFVVIWHRNHLGVLSAQPLENIGGTYIYDFTSGFEKAFGGMSAQNELNAGIWGMIGGDSNADGLISSEDKTQGWMLKAGTMGNFGGDWNFDTQVHNKDKNDIWLPNLGKVSQVPE